jgi:beta-adrenergic-receptor kinase
MKELLSSSHTYSKKTLESVQNHLSKYNPNNNKNSLPSNLFEPYKKEISDSLSGRLFEKYAESEKYTRFCQWKNFELNIQVNSAPKFQLFSSYFKHYSFFFQF